MVSGVTVAWAGIREITEALDALIQAIRDGVELGLDQHGSTATAAMQANHDRDAHAIQRYVNRTWNLTRSIDYRVDTIPPRTFRLVLQVTAWYAPFIEYGTVRAKPYPFFWQEVFGRETEGQRLLQYIVLDRLMQHEAWVRSGGGRVSGSLFRPRITSTTPAA